MDPWHVRLEGALDRVGRRLMEWWVWPTALAAVGWLALVGALLAAPDGEDVRIAGVDLFGACDFRSRTGQPCASCGMTRSWMWAVRGELTRSASYNVAGTLAFFGLVAAGAVATVRLVTRRPAWLALGWRATLGIVLVWFAVYLVAWGLRVGGSYPLPG